MNDHETDEAAHPSSEPSRRFWYDVLTGFPFLFLPLVALIGILCSLVMPILTGVHGR